MSFLVRVTCVLLLVSSAARAEWKIVKEIKLPAPVCREFDMSKSGNRLAYIATPASEEFIPKEWKPYLYDVESAKEIPLIDKFGHHRGVFSLVFSRTGSDLLTMSTSFSIWAPNGTLKRKDDRTLGGRIVTPEQGGHFLAVRKDRFSICNYNGGSRSVLMGRDTQIEAAAMSGDGKRAFICLERKIHVYPTGAEKGLEKLFELWFEPHTMRFAEIASDFVGNRCVVVTKSGLLVTITLDPGSMRRLQEPEELGVGTNSHIAISRDGEVAACVRTVAGQQPVAVSGGELVSDTRFEIAAWSGQTLAWRSDRHKTEIADVAIVSDKTGKATAIVSADKAGKIGIWDSANGDVKFLDGKGPASKVVVSDDRKTVAVIQEGYILLLKDVADRLAGK
jgi:WD40 repeat protein